MGLFSGILDAVTSVAKPIVQAVSPIAPLLGGIAGAAGSYLGTQSANQANVELSKDTMAFNAAEAEKNRQYQSDMSNTAYQRVIADLKAAGLSPMLAYGQGSASTPSGSSASGTPARVESALGNAVNSASVATNTGIQYMTAAQNIRNMMSNQANVDASTSKIEAETVNEVLRSKQIPEETKRIMMDTYLKDVTARMTAAQAAHQEYTLPRSKAEGKYYDTFGYGPFAIRDLGTAASSAASLMKGLK